MRRNQAPPGRTSISQATRVKPFGPHQRARCSGCVQALNTRVRGASKTRLMTSSNAGERAAALVVAAILVPRRLQLAQIALQPIEALLPEAAIVLQPLGRILERDRVEPAR